MPRKTASGPTARSTTPRQGGKVKDTSHKEARSDRTPKRGRASGAKRSSGTGGEIDVPRTTRQKREGSRPGFRTDMDFIDET